MPSFAAPYLIFSLTISTPGTRGTPNPPGGFAATTEDSATILARLAQAFAEMQAQDARVDLALEGLPEVIDSAPQQEEERPESDAPVASSSVEKGETGVRARANMSPLAHKALKRSSGLSMGRALPTPEASRSRVQPGATGAGSGAANELEPGSGTFNPVATSFRYRRSDILLSRRGLLSTYRLGRRPHAHPAQTPQNPTGPRQA
ncbi:hypothetical protein FRC06_009504 [Ceratobasidium sp. 370]|nr:hypothetical protein FRC06_009504 [Ceratobasidium sp. 370]